jgi:hypothetical protein
MATVNQSFYVNLGLYGRGEYGILHKTSDTTTLSESVVGNATIELNEIISFTESNFPNIAVLTDSVNLVDMVDARVKGALKTLFISDERYFSAKPKPKSGGK